MKIPFSRLAALSAQVARLAQIVQVAQVVSGVRIVLSEMFCGGGTLLQKGLLPHAPTPKTLVAV